MPVNLLESLLWLILVSLTAKVSVCQDWTVCKDPTNIYAEGHECPYMCGDFIVDDIMCQADGKTPMPCSGSKSCPGKATCDTSLCIKVACYEPDKSRYSPPFHSTEVCKLKKGSWDWNTPTDPWDKPKDPWDRPKDPSEKPTNKPKDTDNKPGSFYGQPVLPVLLMLLVIITAISVLSCCMKKRQARQFHNRSNATQVFNEPLMDNASARPNIRLNPAGPVTAGVLPPVRPSVPYQAGYFPPATAPYPTLPYPQTSTGNYQAAFSDLPFPKEANEPPPSYSPPRNDQMDLDRCAPPSYFEAVSEDQTRIQSSNR